METTQLSAGTTKFRPQAAVLAMAGGNESWAEA
jgi:hypothetical protein